VTTKDETADNLPNWVEVVRKRKTKLRDKLSIITERMSLLFTHTAIEEEDGSLKEHLIKSGNYQRLKDQRDREKKYIEEELKTILGFTVTVDATKEVHHTLPIIETETKGRSNA
jgi:hypothetical protein